MGTRNLTIVKLNGKVKLAQYCQWDGYPDGQGKEIAEFLQSPKFDFEKFKVEVSKLTRATTKEIKDSWTKAGADPSKDSVSFDISDKHAKMFPEFSRDTGARILPLIQAGKVSKIDNQYSFLNDSLFCEWAYQLNLDNKTVSVLRGFQYSGKMETVKRPDGSTYTQRKYDRCKVFKKYKFRDFTVDAMDKLSAELQKESEE